MLEFVPREGTFVAEDLPVVRPVRTERANDTWSYPARAGFPIGGGRAVRFPSSQTEVPGRLLLDDGLRRYSRYGGLQGAQTAFSLATRVLVRPGDIVVVGEPGYLAAAATFRQAGAVLHRVGVDDGGIDMDAMMEMAIAELDRKAPSPDT